MDLDDCRWMEEVDRCCEQLRRDEELAAKLAAQFEFEDAMQAKDEEVTDDLATKLALDDNLERLVRRFPDFARDGLCSLLEAFNGDVDCVIKELTPPGEFKEELHRAPVAVPQAEDGSGLLIITGCNIAFPSLSQGAKAKKAPVAAATKAVALVRSSSTPTANAPKPTYASRAAELTTDDHFKRVPLLNQYPNIDDGELMNIFLLTGSHVPETIEILEQRKKERRAPPPKPVEVPEERPKNYKIMKVPTACPFCVRVDLDDYPEYAMTIEYIMDLSLVKARLQNGFYRRAAAVLFDLNHIYRNASKFNQVLDDHGFLQDSGRQGEGESFLKEDQTK